MTGLYSDEWLIMRLKRNKPKTIVVGVYSKCDGSELGEVRWHPPWRHYCFIPTRQFDIVLSDRCMLAIGNFTLNLNNKHKEAKKDGCQKSLA